MGAVTSKVVMYKQVLLLVGLVFLSTSVRSHPVKPAADKTADAAADTAADAAGDEAAAPTDAKDAEKGEAPVEENPGDAAEAPSAGGHVAESKIDDAIQRMNELNDLFEEIVQNLGGKTADADAGDADGAAADEANPAADADGAAADDANPAADADGAAADAADGADGAAADGAAAATDAKADAKKV